MQYTPPTPKVLFVLYTLALKITAHSAGAKKYTNCFSAEYDSSNKCPRYDLKQSDDEAPVMLELWGIQDTSSLQSPPGPLWRGVVAPDRVLSMGQIELFDI